jgi:hypothetical protein
MFICAADACRMHFFPGTKFKGSLRSSLGGHSKARMLGASLARRLIRSFAVAIVACGPVGSALAQFESQAATVGKLDGACYVNVREAPYSAVGDGKTDDTKAIQAALNAVEGAGGGIVFVPTGSYLIATHLTVPGGTALVGVGRAPLLYAPKYPGSTLLAVEGAGNTEGTPFITLLGPNSTLEGITIFYPKQVVADAPVPYPWTVRGGGRGDNVSIINVLLVNSYQAVDLGTNSTARHFVQGLYGQPLFKGLWVDQCLDIGRIRDVHFWPFWSRDKRVIDFMTTKATAFIFQRTDWEVVENIFCWGYNVGVELSASKNGAMNGQMADINLDNVDIGLDVGDTQPYAVHISNLNIANAGGGTEHIAIWGRKSTQTAELSVRGASFWGSLNQVLRWEIPGTVSLSEARAISWNPQRPAIEVLAGRAIIHDNSFQAYRMEQSKDCEGNSRQIANCGVIALRIGPAAENVIVHDNQLNGNRLVNDGGSRVALSNNQP